MTGILNASYKEKPLNFNEIVLESTEVDLNAIKEVDGYKENRYRDAIY